MAERKPSIFIPTLYFVEGLPYTIVNMMSVVFFKTLGASNEFIGMTSFLYIPWTIKLFWAPLVDFYSTKRTWILISQGVLAALVAVSAFGAITPWAIVVALFLFAAIAIASATQDIAIDGYYLDVLDPSQQAFYVGVRNAAYKIAWLLGAGGLVYLAGSLENTLGVAGGWGVAFGVCSVILVVCLLFHMWYLPRPPKPEITGGETLTFGQFSRVFTTYFNQPGILAIVVYILIFRLGDALMLKMAQPFLLDGAGAGGLNISTADVGIIYGTVGTLFLLAGGILGGVVVARDGLKKWLFPTAVVQNGAILLYWLLAVLKPEIVWVYVVNSIEQFAYGLGVAAYTVFLLTTVKAEYRAAHYATATALMALGVMLPGAASGFLQGWMGYPTFFLFSFFASIPGIITIFFLPLKDEKKAV